NDQPNEIKEINDADFLFSYEAFLAGLASLPGPPPPGQLNLCQFATYTRPAANVGKRIMVIAAPVLTLTTGIQRQPDWAGTKWKRYDTRAPKRLMAIIPYVEVQGEPAIEARCRAVDANDERKISSSFLERETLWVFGSQRQRTAAASEGVAFEDWLGKLPERLADPFALPQLLLQLIEQDANGPRHQLTEALIAAEQNERLKGAQALVEAMLFALRDLVGPGCVAEDQSRPVK